MLFYINTIIDLSHFIIQLIQGMKYRSSGMPERYAKLAFLWGSGAFYFSWTSGIKTFLLLLHFLITNVAPGIMNGSEQRLPVKNY
jgi:hypothetical protein